MTALERTIFTKLLWEVWEAKTAVNPTPMGESDE